MPLSFDQKSGVRRHLKYPVAGLIQTNAVGGSFASASLGYRFFEAYGQLEYRMNNLMPDEEARLTGLAYGAFALTGVQPNGGDTISVTIAGSFAGSPVTLSATAPPPGMTDTGQPIDQRIALCNLIASAVASNATLQAAKFYSISPYGSGPYNTNQVPAPQCAIICPTTFTLTGTGSGPCVPQIVASGGLLTPMTSLDGSTNINGYLPILDGLEGAYGSASQNLDTAQAGPWKARGSELAQRTSLYEQWVAKLSDFMGVPTNRYRFNETARLGPMRFA